MFEVTITMLGQAETYSEVKLLYSTGHDADAKVMAVVLVGI